jgi:hypothetical protein
VFGVYLKDAHTHAHSQAFGAYLEERGITPELGEYLRFLIYDKEQREYLGWLQKVENFTK